MATNIASSDLFCDVVPDSAATDGHARVPPSFVADTASEGSLPLPSSESSGVSSGPSSVASDSDDGKPILFHCSDTALSPSSRARRRSRKLAVRFQNQDRAASTDRHAGAPLEGVIASAPDAGLGINRSTRTASPNSGGATAPPGGVAVRKKRVAHTKEAIALLKDWLLSEEHVHNPYPTETEKKELMRLTGLDKKQLTNWFTNARKRIWQPRYGPTPKSKKGDDGEDDGRGDTGSGGRGGGGGSDGGTSAFSSGLHPGAAAQPASPAMPAAMPVDEAAAVPVLDPVQERAMDAAATVAPELVTPQQRKRDRGAAPSLEPMELDTAVPLAGAATRADPSPRAPKTPRLEHEYVLSHTHAHSLPAIPAVSRAMPDTGVHLSDMSIFDFQETQRFGDQMIHPLSPVNGFDDTLGSPVECVWLESSH